MIAPPCNDSEAIEHIITFLDAIESHGVGYVFKHGLIRQHCFDESLDLIRRSGSAQPIACYIADHIKQQFVETSVERFHDMAMDDVGNALKGLHQGFQEAVMLLRRTSERLDAGDLCTSFAVAVRCAVLQPDAVTGEWPRSKARLDSYLMEYGLNILRALESGALGAGALRHDDTLSALHGLGLATTVEVRSRWRRVLEDAIQARVDESDGSDTSTGVIREFTQWKERVIDTFVRISVGIETGVAMRQATTAGSFNGDIRAEVDKWCEELEQHLLMELGKKRIAHYWDLVIDFPASVPALEDLQYCLSRCADKQLLNLLIAAAKKELARRLHRAGTCTEDILTVIVSAIRAIGVLLSKHEQSSVIFATVGDTLRHLRDRKDSVAAVVQDLTQNPQDSTLSSDLQHFSRQNGGPADGGEESDEEGDKAIGSVATSWRQQRRPDVLRVLLSTLSVQAIVDEFRCVLAQRLLTKKPHEFDTIHEEEVLERIKCAFGEDSLAACAVMVRDVQMSRRCNQRITQLTDQPSVPGPSTSAGQSKAPTPPFKMSATIVSATCWPKLANIAPTPTEAPMPTGASFTAHPLLEEHMENYAASFRKLKPNQCLKWMPELGRITLVLKQKNTTTGEVLNVSHELGLFSATMVLYLTGGATKTWDELAKLLNCPPSLVSQRASQHHPVVFVVHPAKQTITLQTAVVTASTFAFDDESEKPQSAAGAQHGFSPEQMTVMTNTTSAMLKARGPKTLAEIFNSLKMFIGFSGTPQELKKALMFLVSDGKLSTADGNTFSLPK